MIPQRTAISTAVNTVYLFKSHAKLKQYCDPVLGALGPVRLCPTLTEATRLLPHFQFPITYRTFLAVRLGV